MAVRALRMGYQREAGRRRLTSGSMPVARVRMRLGAPGLTA